MSRPVSIPYVSKPVEDLLLWRDVKKTAAVFGSVTVVFLALMLNKYPFITLLCYLLSVLSAACFLWAQFGSIMHRNGPPVPAILKEGVSEEQMRRFSESLRPLVNKALAYISVLVTGKDLKICILVPVLSYFAARIFLYITPLKLAYLVFFLAFVLPKAYEVKQDEVNQVVKVANEKGHELYAKFNEAVLSKIPKAPTAKKEL